MGTKPEKGPKPERGPRPEKGPKLERGPKPESGPKPEKGHKREKGPKPIKKETHKLLEKSTVISNLSQVFGKIQQTVIMLLKNFEDPSFTERLLSFSAEGSDMIHNGLNVIIQ